jgi:hypothetical protein
VWYSGKPHEEHEWKVAFDERDSEFHPSFPFSRLREKVPDRADEGVGSTRIGFSGELKQRRFVSCLQQRKG